MKKFRRLLSLVVAGVLVVSSLSLTACGNGNKQNSSTAQNKDGLKTIRLGVMTANVDYFAAKYEDVLKIYEKHGIKLEVSEFPKGVNTVDALVAGTVDIGQLSDYATVNRLGNAGKNSDLVIFSQLFDGTAKKGGLYVDPQYKDDLSKLDGSKGFIVNTGMVSEYYTNVVIEKLGLKVENQNFVKTDSDQTSLALAKKGDASAIFTIEALSNHVAEQGWVLAKPAEEFEISTGSYWLTNKKFAEDSELLEEFLKASQEIFDYITDHTDEVAEYFEKKVGLSKNDFFTVWNGRTHRVGFSEEAAAHLDSIQEWAFAHGRYKEAVNIRDFIDVTAAQKAVPDKVTIKK